MTITVSSPTSSVGLRANSISEQVAILQAILAGKKIRATPLNQGMYMRAPVWSDVPSNVQPQFNAFRYEVSNKQPVPHTVTVRPDQTVVVTARIPNGDSRGAQFAFVTEYDSSTREYTYRAVGPTALTTTASTPPKVAASTAIVTAPPRAKGEAAHKQLLVAPELARPYELWEQQKIAYAKADGVDVTQITAQGFNLGAPQTFRVKNKTVNYRVFIRIKNGLLVSADKINGAFLATTTIPASYDANSIAVTQDASVLINGVAHRFKVFR
jgi:hypothetical protein